MVSPQGVYWLLTIPQEQYTPYLPDACAYVKGQLEQGGETGYLHWQLLVVFKRSVRLRAVRSTFGAVHGELSRSTAADEYVWKEDTAVTGTRFELGRKPIKRNSKTDWQSVFDMARRAEFEQIPPDVQVRHFGQLQRIAAHYAKPGAVERQCHVYWGRTGLGKSHRAWAEAGLDAYPKVPSTKFWDGYRGHKHVVVDEFRGGISIEHLLRWLDKYPVLVEIKGSAVPLVAEKIWITSNLNPREWYPGLDELTLNALLRRINIIHFDSLYFFFFL